MIGLMGIESDGTMFTPSGRRVCRVPFAFAAMVQSIQHWVAMRTWR